MINILKLILDFFSKSQIIQRSIAISIVIFAIILSLSFGLSLYSQAKSGKCFGDIFSIVKNQLE